jgi:hypothetical protein
MKTRMTLNQRRTLRDYVFAIGASKSPVLLEILAEIADTNDFELLKVCVIQNGHLEKQPTDPAPAGRRPYYM